MWLPKYQRKLLAFYYHKNPSGSGTYSVDDLNSLDLLIHFSNRKNPDKDPQITAQTVEQINIALKNRGLIKLDIIPVAALFMVSLTPEGMRLGQKYNSWWASSGLWFAEYKDHWFWLILSFLGGIIGAIFVNWLSK
jgi:hypothetical protein